MPVIIQHGTKKQMKSMKKIRNTLMIPLLALAAASCSEGMHDNPAEVEIRIIPQAQVTGTVETKAAIGIDGSTFGTGAQVGLKVTSSAKTLDNMYSNFYASPNSGVWNYFLNGINVGAKLSGFSDWGTVTVMGYHPYNYNNGNPVDFDAIPFRIAGNSGNTTQAEATIDYMVAEKKSKLMNNGVNAVELKFEHLMTYLYLYLSRSDQGPALTLSRVTLEINNGRSFVVDGTYKANAGASDMSNIPALITPGSTSATLDIETDQAITTSSTGITTVPLVIMPQLATTDGDATITATFYFLDGDKNPYKFDSPLTDPSVSFKLSDVSSGAGLLRGNQYRITATLRTYIHFDGAPSVFNWGMQESPNPNHVDI
jgi:hypothetical protein